MIDRARIPTETITVNGYTLAHAVIGEGDPVVMLHGWGVDLSYVWPLAERLAPKGYRVHAVDMPGFGGSPQPTSPLMVIDYAKLVIDYLNAQHLDRVHLFGHSFGGRLGLILGADYSDRLNKMALAGAAGLRKPPPASQQMRLGTYKAVRDGLKAVGLRGLSDNLRGWYNKRYGSADFNAVSGVMRQTFVNVVNQDLSDYAARVTVSTLLIWGENDQDTPLWQGKKLESLIPDAGLVAYPGAGHYSYLENLAQTANAMHALFQS